MIGQGGPGRECVILSVSVLHVTDAGDSREWLLLGAVYLERLDEWKSFPLRFYNTWILNSIY